MENAIWITGASTGIGKSLAIKFANNNHTVIGSARRVELINKYIEEFDNSQKIHAYANNVSSYLEVESFVQETLKNYSIECLINNAGITSFKPFIENSWDEIDDIINTNLKGSIYTIKSVLPQMIENKSGTIINILSVAAKKIFNNSSIYAASKSGLESFAKVIREELREHNIRVINIYPGATYTDIWPQSSIDQFSDKMMTPDNLANLIYDIYSNSSLLSPEEIVVRPKTGDL